MTEVVRGLWWHERIRAIQPFDTSHAIVSGEAAVIDWGTRDRLFALMQGWATMDGVQVVSWDPWTPIPVFRRAFGADRAAWRAHRDAPVRLAISEIPVLAAFTDPAIPTSVRPLDPLDLAAAFGPSVRLEHVDVALTDAPVTRGPVLRELPWLKSWGEKTFTGSAAIPIPPPTLAAQLNPLSFSR